MSGAGRAVELLNDNSTGANFGSISFGGSGVGEANNFDANLRWYFHLDDYTCETVNSTPYPTCTFLNYAGDIGSNPGTNTEVRPFTGNVSAANNTFGGIAPGTMTTMQQNMLHAQTYDQGANPVLGMVDYGLAANEAVVYVDASFSGTYGDSENFLFANPTGACGPTTAYFGVNAFATIPDGLSHAQSGGTVCVAKGTYPASVTVATNPVQIIGDGNTASDTVVTGGVTLSVSGASNIDPLLLQNLRVSGVNGVGISLTGSQSYIAFDNIVSSGNIGDGFHAFGPGTTQYLTVTNSHFDDNGDFPPQFNGDLVAGFNFGENGILINVSISG
ncbi:MAG: hypothetical protein ACREMY_34320, partial [bacterium]